MAQIPKSSRTVLSSGRVAGGQIPFDIADTGQGAEARALGDLGRGISDVGNVFGEIEQRKMRATDLTQSGLDQQSQRSAEDQISLAEQDVSINDRTEDFYKQQYDSRFKFDESKYGTSQGAKIAKINFESRRDNFISSRGITNGAIAVKNAVQLTGQNYVLEPTEENRVKYSEALSLQDTPDGVEAKLVKADTAAKQTLKDRSIAAASTAAFNTWQSTVTKEDPDGDLNAAFKVIEDSDIPAEDKQEAESELKTRVTNRRAESKIQLEAQQEEDLGNINAAMYDTKDYNAATALVESSTLPEIEQGRLRKEIETRAKLAGRGSVEFDDPIALDNASTAISQVGSDLIDLKAAKQILANNQGKLKSTTAAQFWKDINKAFDSSTSNAYSRVRLDTKSKAIGKSQSALDVLLEALAGAAPKDKEDLEERITTAREKFNLELENFNRWESSMRAWRRSNSDASPEEIQKEGVKSWVTTFEGLSTEQLRTRSERRKTGILEEARSKKISEAKAKKLSKPVPIRVVSPEGKEGTIMSDRLTDAIKAGWKKL